MAGGLLGLFRTGVRAGEEITADSTRAAERATADAAAKAAARQARITKAIEEAEAKAAKVAKTAASPEQLELIAKSGINPEEFEHYRDWRIAYDKLAETASSDLLADAQKAKLEQLGQNGGYLAAHRAELERLYSEFQTAGYAGQASGTAQRTADRVARNVPFVQETAAAMGRRLDTAIAESEQVLKQVDEAASSRARAAIERARANGRSADLIKKAEDAEKQAREAEEALKKSIENNKRLAVELQNAIASGDQVAIDRARGNISLGFTNLNRDTESARAAIKEVGKVTDLANHGRFYRWVARPFVGAAAVTATAAGASIVTADDPSQRASEIGGVLADIQAHPQKLVSYLFIDPVTYGAEAIGYVGKLFASDWLAQLSGWATTTRIGVGLATGAHSGIKDGIQATLDSWTEYFTYKNLHDSGWNPVLATLVSTVMGVLIGALVKPLMAAGSWLGNAIANLGDKLLDQFGGSLGMTEAQVKDAKGTLDGLRDGSTPAPAPGQTAGGVQPLTKAQFEAAVIKLKQQFHIEPADGNIGEAEIKILQQQMKTYDVGILKAVFAGGRHPFKDVEVTGRLDDKTMAAIQKAAQLDSTIVSPQLLATLQLLHDGKPLPETAPQQPASQPPSPPPPPQQQAAAAVRPGSGGIGGMETAAQVMAQSLPDGRGLQQPMIAVGG